VNRDQAKKLCELIRSVNPRNAIEVGFATGRSAACVLYNSPDLQWFVSIDKNLLHMPEGPAMRDLLETGYSNFRVIEADSRHALPVISSLPQPLYFDWAMIDGDPRNRMHDMEAILPMMHAGSVMVVDDYRSGRPNGVEIPIVSQMVDHVLETHPEIYGEPWRVKGKGMCIIRQRAQPIRGITPAEMRDLAARRSYYRGRSGYILAASRAAQDLIDRHGLKTCLELGPYIRPCVTGSDVMDLSPRVSAGRVYPHDASVTPWPIDGFRYDLFVALQVFEHLKGKQREAFAEVRRIAKHAVISLPIEWPGDPGNCHYGISHKQVLSWFHPSVPSNVIEGNGGRRQRLIYVFENL
jgi:hypothetical protein